MSNALSCVVLLPAMAGLVAMEPPTARELENLWIELATSDPLIAQRAITALSTRTNETVSFLEKRLRPVCRPEPERLARLILDLDSNKFKVRETATHELERLGEPGESALRKALTNRPSPEMRRRIEQVLEIHKRERLHPPPDQRRLARAVEVLEQIGTPKARQLLAALAQGAPQASLTRDARGALERLANRLTATPEAPTPSLSRRRN